MRRIIVTEFVTVDGVMEAPENWVFPYFNSAMDQYKIDEMKEVDGLLLGLTTYNIFAGSWPSRTGELADLINGARKYVVSDKPQELTWHNSQLIQGDIAAELTKLKQGPGGAILVDGSAMVVRTLMQHELVDEYRLMVFPRVLGKGMHMFDGVEAKLKLAGVETYDTGVVMLRYEPDRKIN